MQGTIVKGIAGFYYVRTESGEVFECKARGLFRNTDLVPLAGDRCRFAGGLVTEIEARRNAFERPPVANVELMILTVSADPAPSFPLLDRLCCTAEKNRAQVLICVSKADRADAALRERISAIYRGVYRIIFTSAVTGEGIDELRKAAEGRQAAFCGPSGSGKSTLTNLLLGEARSETGAVSAKTLRGRNTTRCTELFVRGGLRLFDTPGFTAFEDSTLKSEEIETLFPEFAPFRGACRFSDCVHLKEEGCAITDAVRAGRISRSRYRSYRELLLAARENESY